MIRHNACQYLIDRWTYSRYWFYSRFVFCSRYLKRLICLFFFKIERDIVARNGTWLLSYITDTHMGYSNSDRGSKGFNNFSTELNNRNVLVAGYCFDHLLELSSCLTLLVIWHHFGVLLFISLLYHGTIMECFIV